MARIQWDRDAEAALNKAPVFVRPLARKKIEREVLQDGRETVTLEDYTNAYQKFRRAFGARGEDGAKDIVPSSKADRPQMVLVDTCPGEIRDCPHLLIPVSEWAEELEAALEGIRFSDRLLSRVGGGTVLFHHKFQVSISGCPNCCSQPQIKDFGLHGQWEPAYEDGCIQCGRCVEACPDGCLDLSDRPEIAPAQCLSCGDCIKACPVDDCLVAGRKGARITIGGKLGRNPHLAGTVAQFVSLDQAKTVLLETAEAYLRTSHADERVGDWVQRTGFRPAFPGA